MTDKAQVNFTVEESAKELAKEKLEHGELSQRLRERIQQIAFGEELSKRAQKQERLEELREKKDNLRSDKREIEADIEDVEQEITRIEEQLDNLERREDKYETSLEMLEESLYDGQRIFEEHGQVQKAAKLGEKEPEDVIAELKERNPEIPDHAFKQKLQSPEPWDGIENGPISTSEI